ncbi:hypothetical protein SK128_005302 [Halocaridina rubra]|uniref:Uncharacterized protein n=1 Tax=Halocaridina rubra TaxID=373956 RepID=A0AAN8WYE1_HALRR
MCYVTAPTGEGYNSPNHQSSDGGNAIKNERCTLWQRERESRFRNNLRSIYKINNHRSCTLMVPINYTTSCNSE